MIGRIVAAAIAVVGLGCSRESPTHGGEALTQPAVPTAPAASKASTVEVPSAKGLPAVPVAAKPGNENCASVTKDVEKLSAFIAQYPRPPAPGDDATAAARARYERSLRKWAEDWVFAYDISCEDFPRKLNCYVKKKGATELSLRGYECTVRDVIPDRRPFTRARVHCGCGEVIYELAFNTRVCRKVLDLERGQRIRIKTKLDAGAFLYEVGYFRFETWEDGSGRSSGYCDYDVL